MDELPIYLQIEILAQAPYRSFMNLCTTNVLYKKLCNGEYIKELVDHGNLSERLYKLRCEYWFDEDMNKLKPDFMTWNEFYTRMHTLRNRIKEMGFIFANYQSMLADYIWDDKLWEVQIVIDHIKSFTNNELISLANIAASEGKLNILEWFKSRNILPNAEGANDALEHDRLDILKWLEKEGIKPSRNILDVAVMYGYLDILKWLREKGINLTRGHVNKILGRYDDTIKENPLNNPYKNILMWLFNLDFSIDLSYLNLYPIKDQEILQAHDKANERYERFHK